MSNMKNMKNMTKSTPIAFALLAFASAAQAHQIWLEQPAGQNATIRFGEFGENLREASPGTLDKLGATTATLISAKGEKAADGVKTANGFTLPFKPAQGEAVVAEAGKYPLYKVKKAGEEQMHWYYPTARMVTDFAPQAPKLALDLVPAGKPGEFQLFFRGKPLPKTKVALVTQSGWAKEKQTDAEGKVSFDMPWKGPYVAEASHNDSTPGERQGANGAERYQAVAYVTTLSYVKADGVEPIPAAAPESGDMAKK